MDSSGLNLVMTVIGFAVSAMFIVFVCTRLVCARIQLTASRRAFPAAGRSDLGLRGIHGLEPVLISTFPTKRFSDQFFSSGEDLQCTVCLGDYQDKDILRILPYCGHAFHVSCIDIWLQRNSTCPVCRVSLKESPDQKRLMQPLFSPASRASYTPDETDGHSYNCSYDNPGYSARRIDSLRMETIQENPFVVEFDDTREVISTIGNGGADKRPCDHNSDNRRHLVCTSYSHQEN